MRANKPETAELRIFFHLASHGVLLHVLFHTSTVVKSVCLIFIHAEVLDDGGEDGVFKDTLSALRPDQMSRWLHTYILSIFAPSPSPFSFLSPLSLSSPRLSVEVPD